MTRVAAIDCGTNSIRLLIASQDPSGALVDHDRRLEIVRLGQGIDATGEFHPDALTRTFSVVDSYAQAIRAAGVPTDGIHFVATSAARDAKNRAAFFAGIHRRLAVTPDVISGNAEAQLSFRGALSRIRAKKEPVLVMDIGGGSTELVAGTTSGQIRAASSLDIGSVRLTERFLPGSPPSAADLDRAARYVDDQLVRSGIDLTTVGSWIGVAGTATTLAAVYLGLQSYDRDKVHGSVIPTPDVAELLATLSSLTLEQIRAIPSMHPQRADVITAGTLIASRVAAAVPATELIISESDILDGIALDLLRRNGVQQ
jgi:exopolyphosphatase / guanosine-5'-triphosphate,3'-diphosphate pyrophosphatase